MDELIVYKWCRYTWCCFTQPKQTTQAVETNHTNFKEKEATLALWSSLTMADQKVAIACYTTLIKAEIPSASNYVSYGLLLIISILGFTLKPFLTCSMPCPARKKSIPWREARQEKTESNIVIKIS